jgi:hypothetical protein
VQQQALLGHVPAQDLDRRRHAPPQVQAGIDVTQAPDHGRRVEGGGHRGVDQRGLVAEDTEDRPLGDAGGVGDLPGADVEPVLLQQRHGGDDQSRPPLVRRERRDPLPLTRWTLG